MRVFNAGKRNRLLSSRGMVLIAVLIFMATIVPVTILILDSVRLESLIPINENYVEIADKQAELGFYEAIALIMEDEHLIGVDPSRQIPDDYQNVGAQDFIYKPYQTIHYDVDMVLGIIAGTHDIDYLAEPWARHPDNRTYFILERSLENVDHGLNLTPGFGDDEQISSVPARWQLQDVPIGMDDFGELILDYYEEVSDEPGLMPVYENYRDSLDDRDPIGARHLAPHSITQYDPDDSEHSFDWPIASYMDIMGTSHDAFNPVAELDWMISPADFNYVWPNQYPRPASYFRNSPPSSVDDVFSPENLVYDSMYDGDELSNQYLPNAELQEAVAKSTWANTFFGNSYTNNKEYKPAPGSVYPAPIGSEGDVLPAWHETIISDESGRFPINLLMNIIFTSHNYRYYDDGDTDAPVVERDQWDDVRYDVVTGPPDYSDDHSNHGNYMLARDMVISLLMTDQDLRGESPAPRDTPYNAYVYYEDKAEWILRQMLYKRYKIDEMTDYNADGTWDETYGENGDYAALSILDGNGRRGDGADMWDGTWNIYNDPKSILSDYAQDSLPSVAARPTVKEFERLNQRVTVYSFDTEFIADFQQNSQAGIATEDLLRLNINRIKLEDVDDTPEFDESRGYGMLRTIIGRERAKSIIRWRNGVVDLNGDGDLLDEFIEQPIREPLDDEPISTITYRERGHPNFQDPTLLTGGNNSNHILFDPDYLNIPNLGSLLTIPMSVETGQIIYSYRQTDDTFDIYTFNPDAPAPPGALIPTGSSGNFPQYPNLNSLGTEFLVQDSSNGTSDSPIDRYDMGGGIIDNNVVPDSWHPSYNYDNTKFCYVREEGGGNREIYVYDILAGTETSITSALPPGIEIDGTFPFGTIINNETGFPLLPDFLSIDISAPDYSPVSNDIVFSAGNDSAFDPNDPTTFSSTNHLIYRISDTGFGGPTPLSQSPVNLTPGVHDVCPVFVSTSNNGDWVIFSRLDLRNWDIWPRPPGQPMQFPMRFGENVTLWAVRATGGTAQQIDLANNTLTDEPYHFQLFPTVSPDNSQLAFVAITLDIPIVPIIGELSFNIYSIPLALPPGGQIPDSGINLILDSGALVFGTGIAWCPDWGNGPTLLAYQRDTHSGFRTPLPVTMTGIDPADRELLAVELQEASVALRYSMDNGMYQQFRLRDYPGVSSLQVLALRQIYDKFCVRDPRVYNPQENPFNDYDDLYLQAYAPRININTAPRPVLRTILLTMFQGPVWDNWNNYVAGPAPRGDDPFGAGIRPINLAQPITETGEADRLLAIQIADTYAHQIDEYRRWVYNNKGIAGITQETVPDNLALLVGGAADQRYNFRGNPFYPIDLDNNPDSIDKPFFDPAPPFRSVADIFRVMLYREDLGPDWRAEGIDSIYGPDEDDLPETIDVSTGNPTGDYDAVEVWGPIYIEAGEITVTHGGFMDTLPDSVLLPGFDNHESIQADPPGNLYLHSQFRLFSADDFKRVEQYFTTRTYVYRIESRGVVRIGSGVNRMDITRDKFWIVSVNRDAVAGYDDDGDPGDIDGLASDSFGLFHADPGKWYSIIAYEEQQQGGFKLTRDNFTPPKYFDRSF